MAGERGRLGWFQKAVLGHCSAGWARRRYWDVSAGKQPIAGVSERPPPQPPVHRADTIGMSCQRMPVIEQYAEDASSCARIELALATTCRAGSGPDLPLAGQYPWRAVTWFGPATASGVPRAATFPLGGGTRRSCCSTSPPGCSGRTSRTCPGSPSAATRAVAVDRPISERERLFAKERGSASLVTQLAAQRRSWVVGS